MFRPEFIEKENMSKLGFDLISDKDGYLKFQNNGKIHYNKDYNRQFPEPKGKVILYINTTYHSNYFYMSIRQDGDTRNSYNGVCNTEEFLVMLFNNIR